MVHRQKSGSMICPGCGRLISTSSPECIHCGRKNPGLYGFGPDIRRFLSGFERIDKLIIGFCSILYVISLLIDPMAIFRSNGIFEILSPSGEALYKMGMTGAGFLANGSWWTMFTAVYLHGNLLHVVFNMLWVSQLGVAVNNLFGPARTWSIFSLAGVFGFLVSNLLGVPATIGASGAIFGLLGALVYYGRSRGGYFGWALYRQVGTWAIVLFLFGFIMPGVNNFAHAGGFIAGYAAAMLLGYQEKSIENKNHRLLAYILLGLTVLSFVLVAVK
jgi:rhomboid protease GluP